MNNLKLTVLVLVMLIPSTLVAQSSKMARATIKYVPKELAISSLDDHAWQRASEVAVGDYWSGKAAPAERGFKVRMLWSKTALYLRFEAVQSEPLVISENPDLKNKVKGLWDRDVCEIFIAPDREVPNKYFEFEIAPNGEWIDLGIEVTPKERLTDWNYMSKMESAARIEKGKVVMAIKVPFASLGRIPKAGDVWLGNLFRCVGKDPTRGYLSWRPTKTPKPNFHVPAAFGEFQFINKSR